MRRIIIISSMLVLLWGCSGYRMTSNVPPASKDREIEAYPVLVTQGDLPIAYDVIGPLEVSIRPATFFGAKPTEQQARLGLMQKARELGATAVINVTYKDQFDIISWGHIDARGIAVKEK